jgi:hypothetical protein
MRWRFCEFDEPDSAEARERQALREAMGRWWDAFARQADAVDRHFEKGADFDLPSLMEFLAQVDPRLMWEFGPGIGKAGHRLCITPEIRQQLRPMLNELLALAPSLDRWQFYPYRVPDLVGPNPILIDGRTNISREGVTATATRGRGNRIDLHYFLPASAMTDDKLAQAFAFYTTERMVGEEMLDKWIAGIGAVSENEPIQTGAKRLPLDRLSSTIGAVVQSIIEQLPLVPRYAHNPPNDPEKPIGGVFKFPPPPVREDYPGWSDLMFASAREIDLWRACHGPAFYSDRYSRCGESFCYLKIDRRTGPDLSTVDARGKVEEALSEALAAKQLGCCYGGGTGRIYSYIELAITDVSKSVPLIRQVLRAFGHHERSWLLFHDQHLADEWIGGTDETPAPAPLQTL